MIKGVAWVSTLDGRTSPICQARDGIVFPVSSGPRPPAHPNCRSTTAPVLRTWKELGVDDFPEAPEAFRPAVSDNRTRVERERDFRREAREKAGTSWASMTQKQRTVAVRQIRDEWQGSAISQVSASTTYEEWFRRQPTGFQDDVLGKKRAREFRAGKLSLDKFVDMKTGRKFTLKELGLIEQ